MYRSVRRAIVTLSVGFTARAAEAQEPRFLYPAPPAAAVTVSRGIAIGGTRLAMDVYRPSSGAPAPALIFFNLSFGESQRDGAFYVGWARTVASKGVVGIIPDLRADSARRDFQSVVAHIVAHASDLGIDPNAIALYAGSGNVYTALPIVEDSTTTAIRAAVMYYGSADVREFRRDLPLLWVRAGLDRPGVNTAIATLAARAVAQNAPVTLLNHPTGHHAFEIFDDDDATRDVIDRTIDFVRHATSASVHTALRAALPEATAAAHVATGNYGAAALIYRDLVRDKPDDARLRLSYGESLLGDAKFGEACAEFERLKGKGLGARDLGLPAARACLQKGDQDAAIAWLKSIPSQYLPRSIENEAAFAALKSRADFRALFQTPP